MSDIISNNIKLIITELRKYRKQVGKNEFSFQICSRMSNNEKILATIDMPKGSYNSSIKESFTFSFNINEKKIVKIDQLAYTDKFIKELKNILLIISSVIKQNFILLDQSSLRIISIMEFYNGKAYDSYNSFINKICKRLNSIFNNHEDVDKTCLLAKYNIENDIIDRFNLSIWTNLLIPDRIYCHDITIALKDGVYHSDYRDKTSFFNFPEEDYIQLEDIITYYTGIDCKH